MEPVVSKITHEEPYLKFTLENINVSLANALRRTILSDIPIVVFRTIPHDKNMADIKENTSRMNNEIIKQRLACIPIHIQDTKFPIEEYIINIAKQNNTDVIDYVTTKDFKIIDTKSNKEIAESEREKIFPPSNISGDYIDLVRLRPAISSDIAGEQIEITCKLDIGTAKEDGAYNVVSTCAYGATQDLISVNDVWSQKVTEYKKKGLTNSEIDKEEANWRTLDAKRLIKADSFDFTIESVGIFSNINIVYKACHILINKFDVLISQLEQDDDLIKSVENTMDNCFDIILHNEDYTIGKALEFVLYHKYYSKLLNFCAFNKAHPHDSFSIIRIAFINSTDVTDVLTHTVSACNATKDIFVKLAKDFEEE